MALAPALSRRDRGQELRKYIPLSMPPASEVEDRRIGVDAILLPPLSTLNAASRLTVHLP
jgi:hypothetical protein